MNKTVKTALLVSMLALGACGAPSEVPQDYFFRIDPMPAGPVSASSLGEATIEVPRFVADGSVSNRPLLFSEQASPNSVSEYHYNFWVEAPPVLLKDSLVSYLRAAGVAKRVVTPEMRVNADYSVIGRIRRMEVSLGKTNQGVLDIEMGLRRNSDGELVVLSEYEAAVGAASPGVGSAVQAIERAAEQVFARFVADISAK